jgi:hypothetical protein
MNNYTPEGSEGSAPGPCFNGRFMQFNVDFPRISSILYASPQRLSLLYIVQALT